MLCRIDVEIRSPRPSCFSPSAHLCMRRWSLSRPMAPMCSTSATPRSPFSIPTPTKSSAMATIRLPATDGAMLFDGENRFLDGEYDHEVQRVELSTGDVRRPSSSTTSIRSSMPMAHRSRSMRSMRKPAASSAPIFMAPDAPDVRRAKVAIPRDTYVGSSQLMLLVGRLREGAQTISMHTFHLPSRAPYHRDENHPAGRQGEVGDVSRQSDEGRDGAGFWMAGTPSPGPSFRNPMDGSILPKISLMSADCSIASILIII